MKNKKSFLLFALILCISVSIFLVFDYVAMHKLSTIAILLLLSFAIVIFGVHLLPKQEPGQQLPTIEIESDSSATLWIGSDDDAKLLEDPCASIAGYLL